LGLRRKTQVVIGLVLLGLMAAIYAVTRRTLLVQFSRLEEEQTRQHLDRVSNAINNELDLLNGSARDDSMWDEAYQFVQHPTPEWGERNFGEETYMYLRLNAVLYLNTAGEPLFAREVDARHHEMPARPEIIAALQPLMQLLHNATSQDGASGIVDLPQGPLLVAVWPVVSANGHVPPQGTLIMARWLDRAELERLGWTKSLQFDVFSVGSIRPNDSAHSALPHLSEASSVFISPTGQNQIAGYTLLKDIKGRSSILLRVVAPRSVYQQGRATLTYLMLATLIVGIVFTLANLALLDRMVLSRLIGLSNAVASIGTASDLTRRVPAYGKDEIAQLGASMNSMLAALEHSQRNLRTQSQAIEASADGIGILNERGEFVFVNRAHARIFGYESPDQLIGKSWRVLYSPDEVTRFEREIMPALGGDGRWEGETIAQRRDGSCFPQQVSLAQLADGAMICVCRDLTDLRTLEERLRKKQRMEAIGTLAGGIAHDFNNLLTVIIGYGQTVLAKMESDPGLRSNVEHIVESASRAASLTRQLLAFSRKQVLQPRVLDLNAVVHDLEKMLRPLVGEDIAIMTHCASHLGSIRADLSQIEQVIVNLVVNARDAMPKGGRLILGATNVDLDDHTPSRDRDVPPGRYVVLSVADDGVGMSADVLARIFEPFYTTKEVGKGTGLGLSTVYGIVEQSGGYVSVESKPGKGTEFKAFLPRVNELPESVPQQRTAASRKQGDETVLLVEDDDAVRDLIHDILRSCGYHVVTVAEPNRLESVLQQNSGPIHILLTDVLMPGSNGREVAGRVQEQHPHTKVLYMSGYAFHSMLDRGVLDSGAFFIQKPFTPTQLAEKVREVLDGARAQATAAN
jgi:PAS domain S-box-containing protein